MPENESWRVTSYDMRCFKKSPPWKTLLTYRIPLCTINIQNPLVKLILQRGAACLYAMPSVLENADHFMVIVDSHFPQSILTCALLHSRTKMLLLVAVSLQIWSTGTP